MFTLTTRCDWCRKTSSQTKEWIPSQLPIGWNIFKGRQFCSKTCTTNWNDRNKGVAS